MKISTEQRHLIASSLVCMVVVALMVAGHVIGAIALAWIAILFASTHNPAPVVARFALKEADQQNRSLIAKGFIWVSSHRRQALLDAGTVAERAAFVAWQEMLFLLLVVATIELIAFGEVLHPAKPRPSALSPTIMAAGAVKSIQLHDTTFSTSTTVTTDAGVYQVRGAVSAAQGDAAELKVMPTGTQQIQTESQELCITSSIKSACYVML